MGDKYGSNTCTYIKSSVNVAGGPAGCGAHKIQQTKGLDIVCDENILFASGRGCGRTYAFEDGRTALADCRCSSRRQLKLRMGGKNGQSRNKNVHVLDVYGNWLYGAHTWSVFSWPPKRTVDMFLAVVTVSQTAIFGPDNSEARRRGEFC